MTGPLDVAALGPTRVWTIDLPHVGNAITEPGVGAVDRYRTTVTAGDDGLRLNGVKFYSTGSLFADHTLVAADRDGERVGVMIDTDAPAQAAFHLAPGRPLRPQLVPPADVPRPERWIRRHPAILASGGRASPALATLALAATLTAADSPEKAEFGKRVKEDGLRSALNWRDSRYGKLEADSAD